jgi:hypothetical protein
LIEPSMVGKPAGKYAIKAALFSDLALLNAS